MSCEITRADIIFAISHASVPIVLYVRDMLQAGLLVPMVYSFTSQFDFVCVKWVRIQTCVWHANAVLACMINQQVLFSNAHKSVKVKAMSVFVCNYFVSPGNGRCFKSTQLLNILSLNYKLKSVSLRFTVMHNWCIIFLDKHLDN